MAVDVITGGSGFLGTLLAERLLRDGRDVRVIDVVEPPASIVGSVEWRPASVLDEDAVSRALAGARTVYHSAALVPLTRAGRRFADVNATGTAVVADSALRAGVERLVHVSSSAVFDPRTTPMPITPDTPASPVGRYGASKWAAEQEVQRVVRQGLDAVIIRPRTIVEAGRSGIFQILFDWVSRGARVIVVGDGTEQFQLVSGDDLVESLVRASAAHLASGTAINVGASRFGTFGEVISHLIDHAGTGSEVAHVPAALARTSLATLDRLRLSPLTDWHYLTLGHPFAFAPVDPSTLGGWRPADSNDDMMARAYDHYLAHLDEMLASDGSAHHRAPRQGVLRLLRRR